MPYVAAPMRVLGDIITKTRPYTQLPLDTPTRTRNFSWFTSDVFLKRPILSYQDSYVHFLQGGQSKSGTGKNYLSCLRSSVTSTFKCLIKDTPLSRGIMSTNLRKPEVQDDHKKEMLSNHPQLTCITPSALLGSWGRQPIEDMMSLGTDFEMHANWQGYIEEPVSKDFVARKACTIALSKVQGIHWNMIKCKALGKTSKKLS
jgi:hypothetical protein